MILITSLLDEPLKPRITSMDNSRRNFLFGMPAIVPIGNLMPVKSLIDFSTKTKIGAIYVDNNRVFEIISTLRASNDYVLKYIECPSTLHKLSNTWRNNI